MECFPEYSSCWIFPHNSKAEDQNLEMLILHLLVPSSLRTNCTWLMGRSLLHVEKLLILQVNELSTWPVTSWMYVDENVTLLWSIPLSLHSHFVSVSYFPSFASHSFFYINCRTDGKQSSLCGHLKFSLSAAATKQWFQGVSPNTAVKGCSVMFHQGLLSLVKANRGGCCQPTQS